MSRNASEMDKTTNNVLLYYKVQFSHPRPEGMCALTIMTTKKTFLSSFWLHHAVSTRVYTCCAPGVSVGDVATAGNVTTMGERPGSTGAPGGMGGIPMR